MVKNGTSNILFCLILTAFIWKLRLVYATKKTRRCTRLHPYIGTGKIITFAFHFFHFKTFSGKVEKWFFHFSKAKVKAKKVKKSLFKSESESEKSEKITFQKRKWKWKKWKNHFSKAKVKVKKSEKSLFHFSRKSL